MTVIAIDSDSTAHSTVTCECSTGANYLGMLPALTLDMLALGCAIFLALHNVKASFGVLPSWEAMGMRPWEVKVKLEYLSRAQAQANGMEVLML